MSHYFYVIAKNKDIEHLCPWSSAEKFSMSCRWPFCVKETLSYPKVAFREDELPYYWPQKEGRSEDSQHILSTQDLVSHICDYRGIINSLWLFVDLHKSQIDIFFKKIGKYDNLFPPNKISKKHTSWRHFWHLQYQLLLSYHGFFFFFFNCCLALLLFIQILPLSLKYCFMKQSSPPQTPFLGHFLTRNKY